MRLLYLLPILLLAARADVSAVLHGASYHFSGTDHNAVNAGLGLRYDFAHDLALQVGEYRNSQYRWSTYALADWMPIYHRVGIFAGTANHYALNNGRFIPVAGVCARYKLGRITTLARFIPSFGRVNSAVLSIEFSTPITK